MVHPKAANLEDTQACTAAFHASSLCTVVSFQHNVLKLFTRVYASPTSRKGI